MIQGRQGKQNKTKQNLISRGLSVDGSHLCLDGSEKASRDVPVLEL